MSDQPILQRVEVYFDEQGGYLPSGQRIVKEVTDPDDVEECRACGYQAKVLKEYGMNRYSLFGQGQGTQPREYLVKELCDLCAGTFAGNAVEYPEQYHHTKDAMFANNYTANAILERLDKIEAMLTLVVRDA